MHLLVVALRLAKIHNNEGLASNPRHITAESAVTRITLHYVSPCIRFELRRVPSQAAASALERHCLPAGPSIPLAASSLQGQDPMAVGRQSLGESSRSQARS